MSFGNADNAWFAEQRCDEVVMEESLPQPRTDTLELSLALPACTPEKYASTGHAGAFMMCRPYRTFPRPVLYPCTRAAPAACPQ
jgi:hypothetical protein